VENFETILVLLKIEFAKKGGRSYHYLQTVDKELMMETFFPEILITYLCCFRQAFVTSNFSYFQGFIGACLLSGSRKCITRISSTCFFLDKSISSWERFLSQSHWNLHEVGKSLIRLCLSELGNQLLYANRYIVAVDTTFVTKALGHMIGVQKWTQKSATEKVSVIGHHWAIASFLCFVDNKWRSFPILSRLISGQTRPSHFVVDSHGEATKMSFFDPIIAMITMIVPQISMASLCVVADAYFAKAPFINAIIEMGVGVVTRLRWDAVGWDDPVYCGRGRPPKRGRKWKLASLLDRLDNISISVNLYGKRVNVTTVVKELWLRDVKRKVKLVVIKGKKRPILLVTTHLSLTPKQIIEIYGARFSLEIAIRELKQYIGFGDYQATTTVAFLRFTQLCCCALSIAKLILSKKEPFAAEAKWSIRSLRASLLRFVIQRLLLAKSPIDAELTKRNQELTETILRIAA
jgi:hypothetical protein